MPFSFVTDHIRNSDGYKNWMPPLTQQTSGQGETSAKLITNLGVNSDLIEMQLETSSMMFFT